MAKAELLKDQVRCGQGLDSIVVREGDAAEDEGPEGAVIGFPDVMSLRVSCCTRARKGPPQPFGETQAVGLDAELEIPLLPVQLSQIKLKIRGPRCVRHDAFSDNDVIARGWVGIRTRVGSRTTGGSTRPGRSPSVGHRGG